ncbi:MAG: pilus assembly protein PilW [Pseudomonadota bacterium]
MRLACHQLGTSLVELLIATLLGSVVMAMVASVLIGGQKLVTEQAKQLLLVQNLASVALQIKRDMMQAGYNGESLHATYLTGESVIVKSAQSPSRLGYVYRIASSGNRAFRSVVFKHQLSTETNLGSGLLLCEKERPHPPSFTQAAISGWHGNCFNLFNPKQISITAFSVDSQFVVNEDVAKQVVTLTLSAELVADNQVSHQLQVTIGLRNG